VCELLCLYAQAEVWKGSVDLRQMPSRALELTCRPHRVNQVLGTNLTSGEMGEFFKRLDMVVLSEQPDSFTVRIPSYRSDLQQEIDLIEEIGRVYGLEHIPRRSAYYTTSSIPPTPNHVAESHVRNSLVSLGLQECLTCNLISPKFAHLAEEVTLRDKEHFIHVLHSKSIDQSVLRPSLLPGLLQVCKHNLSHQIGSAALFEVGKVYFQNKGNPQEHVAAAILLMGERRPHHWATKPLAFDFFDLKGYIEDLFFSLHLPEARWTDSNFHSFHPNRQAHIEVQGIKVGAAGELFPPHLRALGIKGRVLFAEFHLRDLFSMRLLPQATDLALYPSIQRDWTLSLPDEFPLGTLLETIESMRQQIPELESAILLDLYKSDQIGKDRKHATLRFIYRSREKTLELDEVENIHEKFLNEVKNTLPQQHFSE